MTNTRNTEDFDLGGGLFAVIGVSLSMREFERVQFYSKHWIEGAPPHEKASRTWMLIPLCCMRGMKGLPEGVEFQRLPKVLTAECKELDDNAELLRRDEVDVLAIMRLTDYLNAKMGLSDKDEKKSEGSSASETRSAPSPST